MPDLCFELRWDEAHTERYYSPSSKVSDYLHEGQSYPVPELLERTRAAMQVACERVRAKYGFSCASAMDTLARIEHHAQRYASSPDTRVLVLRMGS